MSANLNFKLLDVIFVKGCKIFDHMAHIYWDSFTNLINSHTPFLYLVDVIFTMVSTFCLLANTLTGYPETQI